MFPFKSFAVMLLVPLLFAAACPAEEADQMRELGIAALKESQANPRQIVDAARAFVKASELYAAAGNDEKAIEMNSFLYWCKKKMTMEDIDAFIKGGEAAVSTKLNTVEKLAPKADEAQTYLDRAEQFATKNPEEHLLIAIRFYEVADRFKGSDASMKAQDRSLKEMLSEKSSGPKPALPPTATRIPDTAPAAVVSRPVPSADEIKQAEKLIKDLLKDDYAKTDAPGRLALVAKLLQQADENKADAGSEYVLLRDARDYAVGAGEIASASDAQKRLRDAFKIDSAALLTELKRLEATAKSSESATALATLYSLGADDAMAADNYDQAVRFNSRAEDLLPLIKNADVKTHVKAELARTLALKQASTAALAALKTLTTKPDDPEANLIAGKFALQKGEFEHAFAMLAKSSDLMLKSIAKRELTPAAEVPEQTKLGDDWFDRAEKEPNASLKTRMQERAALWYGNALPALNGLTKMKIENRMKTLVPSAKTEKEGVASKPTSTPPPAGRMIAKRWISKDATYTTSSVYMNFDAKPTLLNGEKPAVSTGKGDGFSFHTNSEEDAHIIIDLGGPCVIASLQITNRTLEKTRAKAKTLTVWISTSKDGPWTEVWRAADAALVWDAELAQPAEAQYIKVGLREKETLHLATIKIFGDDSRRGIAKRKDPEPPPLRPVSPEHLVVPGIKGLALVIGDQISLWKNATIDNLPDKDTPVSLRGFLILPDTFKSLRFRSKIPYGSERLKIIVNGEELTFDRDGQKSRVATLPAKNYPHRVEFLIGKSIAQTAKWKWGPLEWSIDEGNWTAIPIENLETPAK